MTNLSDLLIAKILIVQITALTTIINSTEKFTLAQIYDDLFTYLSPLKCLNLPVSSSIELLQSARLFRIVSFLYFKKVT